MMGTTHKSAELQNRYDIFISYRRKDGFDTALLIQKYLVEKGYRVFLDIEALKSGKFNEQLYSVIEKCKDFILVCSPGITDRFSEPEDWVRKELSFAISKKKNIIPVFMRGFEFPPVDKLPEDLKELPNYQALTTQPETFPESIAKLCRQYITSAPVKLKRKRFIIFGLLLLIIIALSGFFFVKGIKDSSKKIDVNEAKVTDAYCAELLGKVCISGQCVETFIENCKSFLAGDTDIYSLNDWSKRKKSDIDDLLNSYLTHSTELSETNKFISLLEKQTENCKKYVYYIDFLADIMSDATIITTNHEKSNILDYVLELLECDTIIALDYAYAADLPYINYERDVVSGYKCQTVEILQGLTKGVCYSAYNNSVWKGRSIEQVNNTIITADAQQAENRKNEITTTILSTTGKMWEKYIE